MNMFSFVHRLTWRCTVWLSSFRCCRALRSPDNSSDTDLIRSTTFCRSLSCARDTSSWSSPGDDGQLLLRQTGVHAAEKVLAWWSDVEPLVSIQSEVLRSLAAVNFESKLDSELSRGPGTLLVFAFDDHQDDGNSNASKSRTNVRWRPCTDVMITASSLNHSLMYAAELETLSFEKRS